MVLLSAPLPVLLERLAKRTNNPYGKAPEQQAQVREYVRTVQPLLRNSATTELDGRLPVVELADLVEGLRP